MRIVLAIVLLVLIVGLFARVCMERCNLVDVALGAGVGIFLMAFEGERDGREDRD